MYHLDYFKYQDTLAATVFPCFATFTNYSTTTILLLPVPISYMDLVPGAPKIDREGKKWLKKCTLTSHAIYGTFSPVTVSEKYPTGYTEDANVSNVT